MSKGKSPSVFERAKFSYDNKYGVFGSVGFTKSQFRNIIRKWRMAESWGDPVTTQSQAMICEGIL